MIFMKEMWVLSAALGDPENSKNSGEIEWSQSAWLTHFKIDVLPNSRIVAVSYGGRRSCGFSAQKGYGGSQKIILTDFYRDADVVVSNAYAKGSEALITLSLGAHSEKDGGDLVTIVTSPAVRLSITCLILWRGSLGVCCGHGKGCSCRTLKEIFSSAGTRASGWGHKRIRGQNCWPEEFSPVAAGTLTRTRAGIYKRCHHAILRKSWHHIPWLFVAQNLWVK